MTGPGHGRLTGRALASLSFVVLAASCSGSGYQYVKDSSSTAFFKLPTAWALFDETRS